MVNKSKSKINYRNAKQKSGDVIERSLRTQL
jgi:hypothetical protein